MALKEKIDRLIHSKHMLWGITLASFLESVIVPIPLEAILIPLMQANRNRIFVLSTCALLGCLLGACVGYGVGALLFDAFGDTLINLFGNPQQFEDVKAQMQEKGFWFVLSVGITPIPFQIAMLAAGVTGYSIFMFLLASAIARAIRYYGLGLLVYLVGNQAEAFFREYKVLTGVILLSGVGVVWWLMLR